MAGIPLYWRLTCTALVFFLTAFFHHAIFYRQTCMLNLFGPDYYPSIVARWLSQDPSFWLACFCALVVCRAGRQYRWLRGWILPLPYVFFPLTVYIWDIPFSGRFICRTFHDHKFTLMNGITLDTLHLYAAGGIAYVLWVVLSAKIKSRKSRPDNKR